MAEQGVVDQTSWWAMTGDAACEELMSDRANGLDAGTAAGRLAEFGPNELARSVT